VELERHNKIGPGPSEHLFNFCPLEKQQAQKPCGQYAWGAQRGFWPEETIMFGKVKSLRELFEIELRYAYDCEQKLAEKGLPSMIESASSPELRSALQQHLEETRGHVTRLQRVFSVLGVEPGTKNNEIIDEMMSAAKDSASNIEDSPLRDAALIVNGNQVEHYEMAMYGTLSAFARSLGLEDAIQPLEQTLKEEKAADAKLNQIAETAMNLRAARHHAA
jgi:ferritin-like metal-binding protein YciE